MRHTVRTVVVLAACVTLAVQFATGQTPIVTADSRATTQVVEFADSVEARRRVEDLLRRYYMNPYERFGDFIWVPRGNFSGSVDPGERCDADQGDVCNRGDPDALVCPHGFISCRPRRNQRLALLELARTLEAAANVRRFDRFVLGQAVYISIKAERLPQALELATDICGEPGWWCATLRAYVLYRAGLFDDAFPLMLEALEMMPPQERCWWNEMEPVLPNDLRRRYRSMSCSDRRRIESRAWWLADPLLLDEWNDRRLEHLFRKTRIRLHEDLWSLGQEPIIFTSAGIYRPQTSPLDYETFDGHISHHELDQALGGHHRGVLAIGFPDSWAHDSDSPPQLGRYFHWRQWVSKKSARYRFLPSYEAFSRPATIRASEWTFSEGDGWERYSPHYGRFTGELDHTRAHFKRGDSTLVAVAVDLSSHDELGGVPKIAGLVFSKDESDQPYRLLDNQSRDRYTFLARRPSGRDLVSLEVIPEDLVARSRYGLDSSWSEGGVELSDLLIYEPTGSREPATVHEAAALMRGIRLWEMGAEVGIYWELYGVLPGQDVRMSLRATGTDGGFLSSLGRALGVSTPDRTEVTWTFTPGSEAAWYARSITVDLEGLEPGPILIELEAFVSGQDPAKRTFQIFVGPPGNE